MDDTTRTEVQSAPDPDSTVAQAHPPSERDASFEPLSAGDVYELRGEIARGGMGVVYRAFDRRFGREVAVKLVHDHLRHDTAVVQRFLIEARITARLEHPGVPPIHDLGTLPDGRPFLAMKLIHGRTLAQLLAGRTVADAGRLIDVFEKVCQTLAFAHRRGVLHRDLKPANVMVGEFGEVQVMDWGIAKDRASADVSTIQDGSADDHTQAGAVLGTPSFMPPEQARGESATEQSDVFGLGGILCVILTGKPPFPGTGSPDALRVAAAGDMSEARSRLAACDADAELVALAGRCLSPRADDRPADGEAVAAAVAGYRAGVEARLRAAEVERAQSTVKAAERRKRQRIAVALAATLVALITLLAGGAWWGNRQATLKRAEELARDAATRSAIEAGLEQADVAVRAGKIDDAELVLRHVGPRVSDFQDDALLARLEEMRTDIRTVRELDVATDGRWLLREKPAGQREADEQELAFRLAFERTGVVPKAEDEATGRRVAESRIATRLVDGLDEWLEMNPEEPGVTAVLAVADPDPLRTAVRAALARRDYGKVRELLATADGSSLPPSFAAVAASRMVLPPADSERLLKPAYARHRDSFPLALSLGAASLGYDTSDFSEAVGYFRAAVALRPNNVRARLLLTSALEYSGRHDDAIREATAARDLAPTSQRAAGALATAYNLAGRFAEAEAAYGVVFAMNPTGQAAYEAYVGQGNLRFELADYSGAADAYRRARAAVSENGSATAYLGDALEAAGQLAAGQDSFQAATSAAGSGQSYQHYRLVLALRDRRRFREAFELLPGVWRLPILVPEEVYPLAVEISAETGAFDRAHALAVEQLRKLPPHSPARPRATTLCEWAEGIAAMAKRSEAERAAILNDRSAAGLIPLFHLAEMTRMSGRPVEADRAYLRVYAGTARTGLAMNAKLLTSMARCAMAGPPTPASRRRAMDRLWAAADSLGEAHSSAKTQTAKLAARKPAMFLLADPDFAAVRDDARLAELPQAERAEWQRVWAKVRSLAERSDRPGRETAPTPRGK